MYNILLTGAQKKHLRGLGQHLDPVLKLGKGGITPAFLKELKLQLFTHELVKLRFLGLDRKERDALCEKVAEEGRCLCIGAIGHTALFYRQLSDPAKRIIQFP